MWSVISDKLERFGSVDGPNGVNRRDQWAVCRVIRVVMTRALLDPAHDLVHLARLEAHVHRTRMVHTRLDDADGVLVACAHNAVDAYDDVSFADPMGKENIISVQPRDAHRLVIGGVAYGDSRVRPGCELNEDVQVWPRPQERVLAVDATYRLAARWACG